MEATERQIEDATMHATVWDQVCRECREMSDGTRGVAISKLDRDLFGQFAWFALTIASAYRTVANTKNIED
ncbi:hypothetical protein [Hyphomicrobium denitrificans]|nr:hypothetical protein [Hyphomicrobium denitrificans]